jgi:predicted ATP-grasp superfamily ATP-dependent carboligase
LFLAGKEILSSLKWSGVAHIDFIYDPVTEHFFMIDFNPRYWGTLTGSVIAGVNFPWLACQSALGNSFPLPEYKNTTYAIIKPKEIFRWMLGKKNFKGISFNSTNLRFVLKDPLPALNV